QERNCEWQGDDIRRSFVSLQWSDCEAAKTSWHWRESCRFRAGNFTGGVTNWIPRYPGWKHPGKRHAPPRCAKRRNIRSGSWRQRTWRWNFSEVPCKKSQLHISRAAGLVRSNCHTNPEVYVDDNIT